MWPVTPCFYWLVEPSLAFNSTTLTLTLFSNLPEGIGVRIKLERFWCGCTWPEMAGGVIDYLYLILESLGINGIQLNTSGLLSQGEAFETNNKSNYFFACVLVKELVRLFIAFVFYVCDRLFYQRLREELFYRGLKLYCRNWNTGSPQG